MRHERAALFYIVQYLPVLNRHNNVPYSMKEIGQKGAAKPCRVPTVECHTQSGLKCTGRKTIICGSGYQRVYGETTKQAQEASVFTDTTSRQCDGMEVMWRDSGGHYVSA